MDTETKELVIHLIAVITECENRYAKAVMLLESVVDPEASDAGTDIDPDIILDEDSYQSAIDINVAANRFKGAGMHCRELLQEIVKNQVSNERDVFSRGAAAMKVVNNTSSVRNRKWLEDYNARQEANKAAKAKQEAEANQEAEQ